MSQIGKLDCRGGDKRLKGRKTEFARGRKGNELRNAPIEASREKQQRKKQAVDVMPLLSHHQSLIPFQRTGELVEENVLWAS